MPPGLLMWTMTARAGDSAEPVERLGALLVGADQAFDLDARDRAAGASASPVRPVGQEHAAAHHRDDGDEHREHAPERQLAPHPAAIDDMIGIERHGLILWPRFFGFDSNAILAVSGALRHLTHQHCVRKWTRAGIAPAQNKRRPDRSGLRERSC